MPRNVRNFWLSGNTSDRDIQATGPVGKDGGMDLCIYVRNEGRVDGPLCITCSCESDGRLVVSAMDQQGNVRVLWEGKR